MCCTDRLENNPSAPGGFGGEKLVSWKNRWFLNLPSDSFVSAGGEYWPCKDSVIDQTEGKYGPAEPFLVLSSSFMLELRICGQQLHLLRAGLPCGGPRYSVSTDPPARCVGCGCACVVWASVTCVLNSDASRLRFWSDESAPEGMENTCRQPEHRQATGLPSILSRTTKIGIDVQAKVWQHRDTEYCAKRNTLLKGR